MLQASSFTSKQGACTALEQDTGGEILLIIAHPVTVADSTERITTGSFHIIRQREVALLVQLPQLPRPADSVFGWLASLKGCNVKKPA